MSKLNEVRKHLQKQSSVKYTTITMLHGQSVVKCKIVDTLSNNRRFVRWCYYNENGIKVEE